jgi:hypothetical protein
MHGHAEIIDALGGAVAVAERLGVHKTKPYAWRNTGIPPGRFPQIVSLASDLGVHGVTYERLHHGRPPPKPHPKRAASLPPAPQLLAGD